MPEGPPAIGSATGGRTFVTVFLVEVAHRIEAPHLAASIGASLRVWADRPWSVLPQRPTRSPMARRPCRRWPFTRSSLQHARRTRASCGELGAAPHQGAGAPLADGEVSAAGLETIGAHVRPRPTRRGARGNCGFGHGSLGATRESSSAARLGARGASVLDGDQSMGTRLRWMVSLMAIQELADPLLQSPRGPRGQEVVAGHWRALGAEWRDGQRQLHSIDLNASTGERDLGAAGLGGGHGEAGS